MNRDRHGKHDLYREAVRATWLGLVVNLALGRPSCLAAWWDSPMP